MADVPNGPFDTFTNDDVAALIAEYPLASICPVGNDLESSALLPLIGEYDDDGRLVSLIGHVPHNTALNAHLNRDLQATIVFHGPNGYVSPEHAKRRDWAPTWNFVQLRIATTIAVDEALTTASLDVLIAAMERNRPAPWNTAELGPRYTAMAQHIVGFRAKVIGMRGRFKLGQDEHPATLKAILASHPDAALVKWMRRCNPGRC